MDFESPQEPRDDDVLSYLRGIQKHADGLKLCASWYEPLLNSALDGLASVNAALKSLQAARISVLRMEADISFYDSYNKAEAAPELFMKMVFRPRFHDRSSLDQNAAFSEDCSYRALAHAAKAQVDWTRVYNTLRTNSQDIRQRQQDRLQQVFGGLPRRHGMDIVAYPPQRYEAGTIFSIDFRQVCSALPEIIETIACSAANIEGLERPLPDRSHICIMHYADRSLIIR